MGEPPGVGGPKDGVSFVIPVRNGARWLHAVLAAVLAQDDGRPREVLIVDDGSTDESSRILRGYASRGALRVLAGEGRGAAAALNLGVRHAAYPLIAQVDQDVLLEPGWLTRLAAELAAPDIAAAQGYYVTPRDGRLWARVMGLDLEQRYLAIRRRDVDHVCTGNSLYRAEALHTVGLFDESLGYGYDNDMSYRLTAAGYHLVFCRAARSVHRWRDAALPYLAQQYGFAYGRLDLVAKHRHRRTGDDVSGWDMFLHLVGMLATLGGLTTTILVGLAGGSWRPLAGVSLGVLALLSLERLVAGARAAARFHDPAGFAFAPVHLMRDAAWAVALIVWALRHGAGRSSRPADSM